MRASGPEEHYFCVENGTTIGLSGRTARKKYFAETALRYHIPGRGHDQDHGRYRACSSWCRFSSRFSGRENIYNNASIFGLSRREIDKRYAQIEFSELEDLSITCKDLFVRYVHEISFAVAINVDADILLIMKYSGR